MSNKKLICFADTETTDLLKAKPTKLDLQPHIIEVGIVVLQHKKIIYEYETLIKPPVVIPYHITKITGITNEMVDFKPRFKEVYKPIKKGLEMGKILVAHNLPFDYWILRNEFKRIDKKLKLPDEENLFCTIEQSMIEKGFRLTSSEIHKIATGKEKIKKIHRALPDVKAMIKYYEYIIEEKLPKHMRYY